MVHPQGLNENILEFIDENYDDIFNKDYNSDYSPYREKKIKNLPMPEMMPRIDQLPLFQ